MSRFISHGTTACSYFFPTTTIVVILDLCILYINFRTKNNPPMVWGTSITLFYTLYMQEFSFSASYYLFYIYALLSTSVSYSDPYMHCRPSFVFCILCLLLQDIINITQTIITCLCNLWASWALTVIESSFLNSMSRWLKWSIYWLSCWSCKFGLCQKLWCCWWI